VFNIADCLPVNASKFREALLGKIGFEASTFHVLADEPQHLTVGHSPYEAGSVCYLHRTYSMLISSMFLRRIGPDPHANGAQTVALNNCPDIWALESGDFAIIGIDITDIASSKLPPTASCGPDERIVRIHALYFGQVYYWVECLTV
jgi:hypothetical protein